MTSRRVKNLGVFAVTSIVGILAYVWLILVVLVITPKVVDIWEAALTLLMFPALIVISYFADVGFACSKQVGITGDLEIGLGMCKTYLMEHFKNVNIVLFHAVMYNENVKQLLILKYFVLYIL